MKDYITENWVEIAGAVLSLLYLYLSIREKSALWIFGFISSLLYIFVFNVHFCSNFNNLWYNYIWKICILIQRIIQCYFCWFSKVT